MMKSLRTLSLLSSLYFLYEVAQADSVVNAGRYLKIGGDVSRPSCPESVDVTTTASTIPPQSIKVDGIQCTSGLTIRFRDVKDAIPEEIRVLTGLTTFLEATISSRLTCGNTTLPAPAQLAIVRFSKSFKPRNVPNIISNLFPVGANGTDVSISPNVDYLVSSLQCVWQREPSPTGSSPTPSVSLEPSAEADDDENVCFPADASVRLRDGTVRKMHELRIGDHVQTGRNRYSQIFAWSHFAPDIMFSFVRLHTHLPEALVLTASHLVYKADGSVVAARDIVVGDGLVHGDLDVPLGVVKIDRVRARGLFNPQTVHGDIVVQGIQVSTYTLAVDRHAAHALLTPVRAAFQAFMSVSDLCLLSK